MQPVDRREFLFLSSVFAAAISSPRIVIRVQVLADRGAHGGKGLDESELSAFRRMQEKTGREYASSGISFDLRFVEGAFLRTQGYSEIPDKFLARDAINLFVTDQLAYDIDRDRTGGCSTGPRPRFKGYAADPYYKTFLGLRQAGENTLAHEYAHHLTLDTTKYPTGMKNLWADIRNDYFLWRQRHGAAIPEFRACQSQPWAKLEVSASRTGPARRSRPPST
jgi:hypothetical protein